MNEYDIKFTKNELELMWCLVRETVDNCCYSVFNNGYKKDLDLYHTARTIYGKLHKQNPTSIKQQIKGISNKKYILTIIRNYQ